MSKILVVDDSGTVRSLLRIELEGAGYEVIEAMDGQNGLEAIQSNSDIDLVLCDVNMPRMDGVMMVEAVHRDEDLRGVPIFMLTTESNESMIARGKAAGVVAWIVKPFNVPKLLAAIEKVVNKG